MRRVRVHHVCPWRAIRACAAAVPCVRSFIENVYGDDKVELVEECMQKRQMIVNTAFTLASDSMLDMELRKFAYFVVTKLDKERAGKFSPTDLEVLGKDAATLALSRPRRRRAAAAPLQMLTVANLIPRKGVRPLLLCQLFLPLL